jgi:hypothetical protein
LFRQELRRRQARQQGIGGFHWENDLAGAGDEVLTLGLGVTIDEIGGAGIYTGGYTGDGIVNQGNISQTASGGALTIYGNGSLTNSATITAASSSGTLIIQNTRFTNSGTLAVSNGEEVYIEATTFTNLPAHTLIGGPF